MDRLARAVTDPGRALPVATPAAELTVVLADSHFLAREGLRRLLEGSGGVRVVAAVPDVESLLAAVAATAPDAVVTDIPLAPTHTVEGVAAARHIRGARRRTGVVVLSPQVSSLAALELFRDGTAGLAYLVRDSVADLDQVLRALRAVVAGGSVVDPLVVEALLPYAGQDRRHGGGSAFGALTERERDVLAAMARGRSNGAIAADLFISGSAVEKHITSIFDKLGLGGDETGTHRRVAAVLTYLRETGRHPGPDDRRPPSPPARRGRGPARPLLERGQSV